MITCQGMDKIRGSPYFITQSYSVSMHGMSLWSLSVSVKTASERRLFMSVVIFWLKFVQISCYIFVTVCMWPLLVIADKVFLSGMRQKRIHLYRKVVEVQKSWGNWRPQSGLILQKLYWTEKGNVSSGVKWCSFEFWSSLVFCDCFFCFFFCLFSWKTKNGDVTFTPFLCYGGGWNKRNRA